MIFTDEQIAKASYESLATTFAGMAFLEAAGDNHPGGAMDFGQSFTVSIGLSKPTTGELTLCLSLDCKRRIVENIYAAEFATLTPREIDDGLLEFLNVLAGNFLYALHGPGGEYQIDFPRICYETKAADDTRVFPFFAEGAAGRLLVVLK